MINNKRIAKNTLFLYIRMLLLMGISLYTSRIFLNTLGVEDYGIYNVVGGVVGMLSFLNNSLGTATQRYLNAALGEGNDKKLSKIFSSCFFVHLFMAVIVVIIAETVGLWFVQNKLVIPDGRETAALWAYHTSVIICFIVLIVSPFNSAIIAHEKMNVYAYLSIVDGVMKLVILFILIYLPYDKLIVYSLLLLCITIISQCGYILFSIYKFKECHVFFYWDKKVYLNIGKFTSFMFVGTMSQVFSTHGVNILINIFGGPVFNAARAIAVQVQTAVSGFINNYMVAVNPQIVKSYVAGDTEDSFKLVYRSSKYGFFLLLFIIVPIIFFTDYILLFWLKNPPPYTSLFVKLVLCELLVTTLFNPLGVLSQAVGNIRNYQMAISILFILIFIVTFIFYKLKFPIYTTFVISIFISLVGLFVRLFVLSVIVKFDCKDYLRKIVLKIQNVLLVVFIIYIVSEPYISKIDSFCYFSLSVCGIELLLLFIIYRVGLVKDERYFISKKIEKLKNRLFYGNNKGF